MTLSVNIFWTRRFTVSLSFFAEPEAAVKMELKDYFSLLFFLVLSLP